MEMLSVFDSPASGLLFAVWGSGFWIIVTAYRVMIRLDKGI